MPRCLCLWICLATTANTWADSFDRYTNTPLAKAQDSQNVRNCAKLLPSMASDAGGLFPETGAALVIVRTNGGMNAKLLLQFARQKQGDPEFPMALLERVTCYKPGQERAVQVVTPTLHLYPGFVVNLELGQVVPEALGGDLRYVQTPEGGYLEPVKNAKLFLLTKHLPDIQSPSTQPQRSDAFEPSWFAGKYQLVDDGRRKAALEIALDSEGNVTGNYTSDQSGRAYEVSGKWTPTMKHQLVFTVKFPNSTQEFTGYLFTKDAGAICGHTRFQGQEFGFYAVREK